MLVACDNVDAAPGEAAASDCDDSVASHGTGSTVGKTGGTLDDEDDTTGVWIMGVGGERFVGS